MNRRTLLLALGSAAGAGARAEARQAALPAGGRAGPMPLDRLGVQAGVVRAALTRDFGGTLERIAALGYTTIELQWYGGNFGRSPSELRAAIARTSLRATSALVHPGVMTKAGHDPATYLRRAGERYRLFHLKDLPPEGQDGDRPIGDGRVDFQRILAAVPNRHDRQFFVEHAADAQSPFEALGRSYQHLARLVL